MTTHAELLARQRSVLPSWQALYYDHPIALVSGKGRHVTDAEGRRYLDFFGGILTTSVGHGIEEIEQAARTQLSRITHTSTLYLIESEIALAERLAQRSGIADARVFLVNSGSEANEAALLCATLARSSPVVLALRNSYHGRTFATLAVTGNQAWRPTPLSPFPVTFLDAGGPGSALEHLDDDALVEAVHRDLVQLFRTAIGDRPACVIVEPVQGVGGFVIPRPGVLGAIAEEVARRGGLLIVDEVQTAFGRTGGRYFGFEHHGLAPDAITLAKGLANGLPIGAVIARADVMNALGASSISTFGGNPVIAAAALATLDYIDAYDLPAHVETVGAQLLEGLRKTCASHPLVAEVRGLGLMIGVELAPDGRRSAGEVATAFLEYAREAGLLVGRGGLAGNVLRIAPPMTLTGGEADEGVERFAAALGRLGQ